MSKPLLYSYFRSSCSWRVRIALAYKGMDYDIEPVNILKNDQKSEKYKTVNPQGKVPAITINGNTFFQSISIIEYLEEIQPEPPLLPKDPILRAKIRGFVEGITCDIQPLQNVGVLNYLEESKRLEWAAYHITRGFEGIETVLSETSRKYCFGNEITLADVCLVPQVHNANRYKVDMLKFPIISRINDELEKLDYFKVSHPFQQLDCPDDLKRIV